MALNLLNVFMTVNAQCQYSQSIRLGEQYYIYNLEYPDYYSKGTNCRWSARSDPGTQIVLTCEDVDLPQSQNCQYDKLSISLTGNVNFADAHNYCGKGTLSHVSDDNAMEIGLFSPWFSPLTRTGRFICSITAIQSDVPTTTTRRPVTCDCGWKQGLRITGGHETGVNEFPFMAALVDASDANLFCGSNIISERYAITAAHCTTNKRAANTGLLVGDHNISTGAETPYAQVYKIQNFIVHPQFEPTTQQNDIALVKTVKAMTFSMYVGPICLPFRYTSIDLTGLPVIALGWGSDDFSSPRSQVLQEVTIDVISNGQCSNTEKYVRDSNICTFTSNKDTCQGDSGGPLAWMATSTRRLQLVGVVSYGLGCATARPSVNARVTSYLSWIISQTPDTNYCIR